MLHVKSKTRYNQTYDYFLKWCSTKNIEEINENVLLVYFSERSEVLKSPASLWSEYSMLKLTISLKQNEDISKFQRLKFFLKRKNDGYQPRKSKIFTKEEISKFLTEAPNQQFLFSKVIAIMGVAGACRTDELYKMKINDVTLKDDVAIILIADSKNNLQRTFAIMNQTEDNVDWLDFLKQYMKLRPKQALDNRLFYRYDQGRCVNQVVGRNTISKVPKQIAKFLKLDNVEDYTGHAFRLTSATILANASGANILDLNAMEGENLQVLLNDT